MGIESGLSFSLDVGDDLVLRTLAPSDAGVVSEIFRAEGERLREKSFVRLTTEDEHRERIERMRGYVEEGNAIECAIVENDVFLGEIGMNGLNGNNRAGVVHYWLRGNTEGRGVMTRCVRALTRHAFTELSLNRIEISVFTTNARSRRIPERLGFQLEGILRDEVERNGELHDLAVYSMLAREWEERLT